MAKISVTLLKADWSNLASDLKKIEKLGADYIQHDVMDGRFVPNISFGPYAQECAHKATKLPIETHMMVEEPQRFAADFRKAGCSAFIIHVEACEDVEKSIVECEKAGLKVGLAVSPGTPVEQADKYLRSHDIAVLLIMGVNPGFGGQSYILTTNQKIHQARRMIDRMRVKTQIEVDGGVNDETAMQCLSAGADILAVGSFVTGNLDSKKTAAFIKSVHDYKRETK